MSKEYQQKPIEVPVPVKIPDISKPLVPEVDPLPSEDPDAIPEEDPFETPPPELPEPGEGP